MAEPSSRWRPDLSKLRLPAWARERWSALSARSGRLMWPLGAAVGVLAAAYFGYTALWGGGEEEQSRSDAPSEFDGWLSELLRLGGYLVLAAALLAAFTWLLKWLSAQGLAPRLRTVLKLALALTPLSVWMLANLDWIYQPMEGPLRSYLLLIACPFVIGGLLVALDRRRAPGLAALAILALAGLFLGAGLLGRDLLEPIEYLRDALIAREPDQRMWWLALAILPAAIFAVVSAVGDRPDEQA